MPNPAELYDLYLLNNPDNERIIEVISISHPDMTQTYHITPTPEPVTVVFEDNQIISPEPKNMTVEKSRSKDDLDEQFIFNFSDPEGLIASEASLIPLDTDDDVLIQFRTFMASDPSGPAEGPFNLAGVSMTASTDSTVTIRAQSPSLIVNRTGELYTYERFPMLRGFL